MEVSLEGLQCKHRDISVLKNFKFPNGAETLEEDGITIHHQ